MPHLYLDKRKNPPVWRYQIWDAAGRRRSFTGTTSKRETTEAARRRQLFENEIRDGVRQAPKHDDRKRGFDDTLAEYIAWGESQGGRGGRPWAFHHARAKGLRLAWWKTKLNIKLLNDLQGILPRVEKLLREKQAENVAGKTLALYAESLVSFCKWCIAHEYMLTDPLKRLRKFDITPRTVRRLMTPEEIQKLLDAVAPERRLVYEAALSSGLRVSELAALQVRHLDVEHGGVHLDPEWTKNRKPGFQPLPSWMVNKLAEASKGKLPFDKILRMPGNAIQSFDADLRRAGIPKWAPGGKLDFHAMRVAYITHVIEAGADIKTAQTLARHCTPQLTLGIYARTRPERLKAMAEAVGNVFPESSKGTPPTQAVNA